MHEINIINFIKNILKLLYNTKYREHNSLRYLCWLICYKYNYIFFKKNFKFSCLLPHYETIWQTYHVMTSSKVLRLKTTNIL